MNSVIIFEQETLQTDIQKNTEDDNRILCLIVWIIVHVLLNTCTFVKMTGKSCKFKQPLPERFWNTVGILRPKKRLIYVFF